MFGRSFTYYVVVGSNLVAATLISDMEPASSMEFLNVQANCRLRILSETPSDMMITYSQIYCTDKYSQHSSVICQLCHNFWVFVHLQIRCGFKSAFCHLTSFAAPALSKHMLEIQTNYRVWISS